MKKKKKKKKKKKCMYPNNPSYPMTGILQFDIYIPMKSLHLQKLLSRNQYQH